LDFTHSAKLWKILWGNSNHNKYNTLVQHLRFMENL